jgi:molybdenum cofactor cytidylyltransferase
MTGILILAAGQSARLGSPKQKLLYHGNTLLQHAINAALATVCEPVIVVLGAFAEDILPDVSNKKVQIIHNSNWEEGMASSIRVGITELEKKPGITNALIVLCDQPYVDGALLDKIVQIKQNGGKGIIACAYNNTVGVPVLFERRYFADLLALTGHEGAKKILAAHWDDVEQVAFFLGAVDIDTMDDYNMLNL